PKPGLQAVAHAPFTHATVEFACAVHTVPQAPQLFASVTSEVSQPFAFIWSQSAYPVLQARPQAPAAHTGVLLASVAQALPQAPQFARSVLGLTQAGPHAVSPFGHAHAPAAQNWPIGHALPQPPQFAASVAVLTHCPPQSMRLAGHWHLPAVHRVCAGQR